ncbi:MAG: divalent-cation tolerance protein CutA [Candidatus Woesearchaeota archaeon]|jgi:periplasmic divalent cation tolerance protein|nr:divalent-cation tolerance protein CutA [Candidatus Woesearchaeota archaeon]MDP7323899.1 divalent-cation tolerance protein CutA [Candidatus Woesearchaeota archaeon]MDP7458232.1 divalent-cation tolerance protein CutA [Candidatus Woesearchaeota archaeon]
MAIVYITCKNRAEARRIAKELLSKRLIACANYFPISSLYRWKGKIVDDREIALLCKSSKKQFHNIKKEVKALHSYEVPCIQLLESESNKDFADWVKKELKK